jgi:XTP/dITP diphosphohydrolase
MPHTEVTQRPTLASPVGGHTREEKLAAFGRLLDIMDDLREGCPWDRKQTFESLRHLTIEETYELSDAILSEDHEEVGKEVGDLMLHMVFYSRLGSEVGSFDAADVLHGICDKLVHRHPHIYGDVEAATEEEVKANWEKIKLKEKGPDQDKPKGVLDGVPQGLPSMVKAQRIQEKVRGVGFDWDHAGQVWEKVQEELGELQEEVETKSDRMADEFGDVMFALINYARFLDVNPDEALERTNRRFKARFEEMEHRIAVSGGDLASMPLEEMDRHWDAAKQALGQGKS